LALLPPREEWAAAGAHGLQPPSQVFRPAHQLIDVFSEDAHLRLALHLACVRLVVAQVLIERGGRPACIRRRKRFGCDRGHNGVEVAMAGGTDRPKSPGGLAQSARPGSRQLAHSLASCWLEGGCGACLLRSGHASRARVRPHDPGWCDRAPRRPAMQRAECNQSASAEPCVMYRGSHGVCAPRGR